MSASSSLESNKNLEAEKAEAVPFLEEEVRDAEKIEKLPPGEHEWLRAKLKEPANPDTEEKLRILFESQGFRNSDERLEMRSFENSLETQPLALRFSPGVEEVDARVESVFVEKVLREHAYGGSWREMSRTLQTAQDFFSREEGMLKKFTQEEIEKLNSQDAKKAAIKAELLWARDLYRFSDPFLAGPDTNPLNIDALNQEARLVLRAQEKELTRENIRDVLRENLKGRLDALSFWRGTLEGRQEWESPHRLVRFDTALAELDFKPDGVGAYYDALDAREAELGGDHRNYFEGREAVVAFRNERLERIDREEKEQRERRFGKKLRAEIEEELDHQGPHEGDLANAKAYLADTLKPDYEEKQRKLKELQSRLGTSWLRRVLVTAINPDLAKEVEAAQKEVADRAKIVQEKIQEIAAMEEIIKKRREK